MNQGSNHEIRELDDCSLAIYRDAPSWNGRRTAALGRLKLGSEKAARALVSAVVTGLTEEGFEAVVGPMDGDTWHSYRAIVETDGSRPFLMEPVSGPHDVSALAATGFETIGDYVSMRVDTADAIGARPDAVSGIEVVNWDGERPRDFFNEVYDLSLQGFSGNAFYRPISRQAFLDIYMPYVPFLKQELIFFARSSAGELVGYLFGIPDYARGHQPDTAILKTYTATVRGVGYRLADAFHRSALNCGYASVIHALIHADNVSGQRSRQHGAEVFRRYALFGRSL